MTIDLLIEAVCRLRGEEGVSVCELAVLLARPRVEVEYVALQAEAAGLVERTGLGGLVLTLAGEAQRQDSASDLWECAEEM